MKNLQNKEKIKDKKIENLLLEKMTFFISKDVNFIKYKDNYAVEIRKSYMKVCDEIKKNRNDLFKELSLFKEVSKNDTSIKKYIDSLSDEQLQEAGFKRDNYPRYRDNIAMAFVIIFTGKLNPEDLMETLIGFSSSKETKGRLNTIQKLYANLEGFPEKLINHINNFVFKNKVESLDFNVDRDDDNVKDKLKFIQRKLEVPYILYESVPKMMRASPDHVIKKKFNDIKNFLFYTNSSVTNYHYHEIKFKVNDIFQLHKKADKLDEYEYNMKRFLDLYPLDYLKDEILRSSKECFITNKELDERIHENLFKHITPEKEFKEVFSNSFLRKNISIQYVFNHLDFLINRKNPVTNLSVGYKFTTKLTEKFKENISKITDEPVEFLEDPNLLFHIIMPDGDGVKRVEDFFQIINKSINEVFDDYSSRINNAKAVDVEDFINDYFNNMLKTFDLSQRLNKEDSMDDISEIKSKKIKKV